MVLTPLQRVGALFVALLVPVTAVHADWSLDNDASTLSFVTIKADHVAEVHTFDVMSGSIDDAGNVDINVELASVNTLIDIRNERMRNMLFQTSLFPDANISASIDIDSVAGLSVGSSRMQQLTFELSLHGESNSYNAEVMVTRLSDGIVASTIKPILVSADSYDLVSGVEALREIAGLPSISRAVPASFTVVFNQD